MQEFYTALHGDDWLWVNNSYKGIPWDFSNDPNPCVQRWQGVTCSTPLNNETEYINVIALQLPSYNLRGTIPTSIVALTQIEVIQLLTNAISGSIPETLYELNTLKFLDLASNQLNGSISDDLALKIPGLLVINLNNNNFTGTLPVTLSQITGLKQLNLQFNELFGTIPASYGNLNQLTTLDLGEQKWECVFYFVSLFI